MLLWSCITSNPAAFSITEIMVTAPVRHALVELVAGW